jgi:hypothetical protein
MVALDPEDLGQVVEGHRGVGMLGTERCLPDRQGALPERPRGLAVTLSPEDLGQVVEDRGGVAVPGCGRLPDRQGPLEERPSGLVSPWTNRSVARLLRLMAVSGCSGPATFSLIARARSRSGRAAS